MCGWVKPVESTLAVLKQILLFVFAKHFGAHCLKHITVQQSLAHTHHFVSWHIGTLNFNQAERGKWQFIYILLVHKYNEKQLGPNGALNWKIHQIIDLKFERIECYHVYNPMPHTYTPSKTQLMCSATTSTASEPRKQSPWDLRWTRRRFTVTEDLRWEMRPLHMEEDWTGLLVTPWAKTGHRENQRESNWPVQG